MTADSASAAVETDQTGLSRSEVGQATGQPDEGSPSQSILHTDSENGVLPDASAPLSSALQIGNKSSMVTAAPARPQRASAIAAKKRVTDFAAKQQKDMEDQGTSSFSDTSGESGMEAGDMQFSDTSDESDVAVKDEDSDSYGATPTSDTTAVDHLGASRSAADTQGVQPQSETSSGSIKQSLHEHQDEPMKDAAHDPARVPAISAAEAAKTRQTRARKPAVIQTAAVSPDPPARRRTSILKERQRERAASEQTDEDFVLNNSRAKAKGKGKVAQQKSGSKKQAAAVPVLDRTKAAKATLPPSMEDSPEPFEEMDVLLGCTKCRYLKGGCGACRDKPSLERPKSLRWKPDASRQQKGIPVAPTFRPTPEEFMDPLAYIEKIKPEGEKAGICCIVPPPGWAPPFALEKGTNGMSAESFRFLIRRQLTSHLCMRLPNTSRRRKAAAAGRYGAGKVSSGANVDGAPLPEDVEENGKEEEVGEFGFHTLDRTHTLKSFASSADWIKSLHFGDPKPTADPGIAAERSSKRRKLGSYTGPEPTIDEIEGEFWRVIEAPDDVVESFYGQDLDSGHHGSGFPLPPFRQRLLEEHLQKQAAARGSKAACRTDSDTGEDHSKRMYTQEETVYSEHSWNINNLPRCKGSVLRYYIGDELITGVMVPWLYVGSCMSAFCWHVEDHALCSINYLHMGAPKVWYGVPAHASSALEDAMKDALPDLFDAAPDLMYSLVTMVSPINLQARGVPVHRLVHQEGSFVITFPNAYHSGFNTGFNCAEAVNFGPPDWLPYGTDIAEKYRRDGKAITLSHDALLVALVSTAQAVKQAAGAKQKAVDLDMSVTDANTVSLSLSPSKAASSSTEAVAERVLSGKATSSSQPAAAKGKGKGAATYAPGTGKRCDLTFLDPMNKADCPPKAIALAAGELVLRMREEKRRREVGSIAADPPLPSRRMSGGTPGAVDEQGMYTDTEDIDCLVCKCDMWLYAVVSPSCPGQAACTEHAQHLDCPRSQQILLYRHTIQELQALVETAKHAVPGVDAAIAAAIDRKLNPPTPVQITKLGPVNQHLHGPVAPSESPTPEAAAAPAKRTRGPDKKPRGSRKGTKRSKRISKGNTQRREAAAASSRLERPRSASNKRAVRKTTQSDDDVPNVLTRPQRKRKPPVSADASPVAAAPGGTHAMASRKRSRPATAAALEDLNNAAVAEAEAEEAAAQARKPRATKKPVRAGAEHAVAQAVPCHIAGQQAQADQQQASPSQQQHNAVAVAVHPNMLAAGATTAHAAAPNQVAQQVQPALSQAQASPQGLGATQASNPSSLLLLAQQQMQQRLNQQAQLPSNGPQQDSAAWSQGLTQGSAAGSSQAAAELRPLGNATAQQALLAQLISQQAAQGLTGYALDGGMHPFFSQGLAGALLRQGMPSQQQASNNQEQPQQAAQQLSSHLQQSTAALLMQQSTGMQMPQSGALYPGQVISPSSILPMTLQGSVAGTQLLLPQQPEADAGTASQAAQTVQYAGGINGAQPAPASAQPQQSIPASQAVAAAVSMYDQDHSLPARSAEETERKQQEAAAAQLEDESAFDPDSVLADAMFEA